MAKIYIAGAHSRGTTFGYYMKYLNPSIEIIAYLYDNDEENPEYINNVPVIKIDENSKLNTECPVYLGMRGVNCSRFAETLIKCGMQKIIPVDVELDCKIRNKYLKKYYSFIGQSFLKIEDFSMPKASLEKENRNARIFVAHSAFDKQLKDVYQLDNYEKIIQVGTELTDKKIETDCFDNIGENISGLNAQFCELTGLYWLWKHATEDILGLVHYRRHFTLPKDWKERMIYHNIDVVLPVPLYVSPSIEQNYKNRHDGSNWDYMLECLREKSIQEYELASKFFKETALYSPCNMFIMKRKILHELCSWLFPILFEVAKHGGIIEDSYQNRYPGFISERLITFFFEKNKEKYKIVYSDKNFLP